MKQVFGGLHTHMQLEIHTRSTTQSRTRNGKCPLEYQRSISPFFFTLRPDFQNLSRRSWHLAQDITDNYIHRSVKSYNKSVTV
jgi:hypothetical protein